MVQHRRELVNRLRLWQSRDKSGDTDCIKRFRLDAQAVWNEKEQPGLLESENRLLGDTELRLDPQ